TGRPLRAPRRARLPAARPRPPRSGSPAALPPPSRAPRRRTPPATPASGPAPARAPQIGRFSRPGSLAARTAIEVLERADDRDRRAVLEPVVDRLAVAARGHHAVFAQHGQ